MSIKTTLNITKSLHHNLIEASTIMGMAKNDLVMILLKRISRIEGKHYPSKNLKFASQVKYQPREQDKNNWYTLHVRFVEGNYEFAMDLKKVFKLSVSYILAKALRRFLHAMTKTTQIKGAWDSYRGCAYTMAFELVDGVACWKLYWGIPKKLTG